MLITSIPDLGQPLVSVMSNDIAIAGWTFSLVCTVETVEGVRSEDVSIAWRMTNGSEVSGENIEIGDHTTEGAVTRSRLIFSPLYTSERGEYTCSGGVSADSVGLDVSNTSTMKIDVMSKW